MRMTTPRLAVAMVVLTLVVHNHAQAQEHHLRLGADFAQKSGVKSVTDSNAVNGGYWQVGENFNLAIALTQPLGKVTATKDGLIIGAGMTTPPKIGDIKRIAYVTRTAPNPVGIHVVMGLHTTPGSDPKLGKDDTAEYERGITAEPLYSAGFKKRYANVTANDWITFSTDDPDAALTFFDSKHGPAGFNGAPTLQVLASNDYSKTWGDLVGGGGKRSPEDSYAYQEMTLSDIGLFTSHDGGWKGFKADVDQLKIELNNGEVLLVDFDAGTSVPAFPSDAPPAPVIQADTKTDMIIMIAAGVGVALVVVLTIVQWKRAGRRK